jgi:hypothetical protein
MDRRRTVRYTMSDETWASFKLQALSAGLTVEQAAAVAMRYFAEGKIGPRAVKGLALPADRRPSQGRGRTAGGRRTLERGARLSTRQKRLTLKG